MPQKLTRANLERELKAAADPVKAAGSAHYFKTGKGEYGEGDVFLGMTVPVLRKTALRYRELALADLERLLSSKVHEYRAAALEILVVQYKRGSERQRAEIVKFYLRNTAGINNWDLVDGSCRPILGEHLKTHPREILRKLAHAKNVWERRIAMVSTMTLVWASDLDDALSVAGVLLDDRHDLIHKAVGWVLREVGRKNRKRLLEFLQTNYDRLPRTALRYAIEHFPLEQRKKMLQGIFRSI